MVSITKIFTLILTALILTHSAYGSDVGKFGKTPAGASEGKSHATVPTKEPSGAMQYNPPPNPRSEYFHPDECCNLQFRCCNRDCDTIDASHWCKSSNDDLHQCGPLACHNQRREAARAAVQANPEPKTITAGDLALATVGGVAVGAGTVAAGVVPKPKNRNGGLGSGQCCNPCEKPELCNACGRCLGNCCQQFGHETGKWCKDAWCQRPTKGCGSDGDCMALAARKGCEVVFCIGCSPLIGLCIAKEACCQSGKAAGCCDPGGSCDGCCGPGSGGCDGCSGPGSSGCDGCCGPGCCN